MSQANTTNIAGRPGRGRRRRWGIALLVFTLILIGGGLFIITRPWFIMAVVDPEMERMLGGVVEIDRADWIGFGRMKLSGVSVQVPNHATLPQPAGEVATIGEVMIEVNILPLLIGRLSVQALSFDDVVLRFAEDVREAGRFTFFDLEPQFDLPARRGAHPPRVEVHNVMLESAEFDSDRYTVIGYRRVAGSMYPMIGDASTIAFELAEIDGRGKKLQKGLRISGQWDTVALAHTVRLDGLVLDEQTMSMCPQIVRLWWQHMDLTGRVSEAKLDWTLGESFTVELAIEQVGLTLPEQVEAFLVRYHGGQILEQTSRPRMELHSGVIRWINEGVELENLEGRVLSGDMAEDEVVHLPYRISVSIDELAPWDFDRRDEWLAHALEVAPFRMSIETSMDVTQDPSIAAPDLSRSSRAVDLPLPVARVLEHLQLAEWSIGTNVEIWRDPANAGENGAMTAAPIQWRGDLNINDGSLRVAQFPYRLHSVDAALRIEQNLILIEELHARGTENSRFTIDGTIMLPTVAPDEPNATGFDVRVMAVHLPLDDALFAAIPERNRGFFNLLFARPLYESFERVGLVGDAAHADDLHQQLTEIETVLHEHSTPQGGRAPDPAMLRERDQLIAQIERGPIRLGGNVHLDLQVRRDVGQDRPTLVNGSIEPDAVGVVFDRFPYPFTIVSGKLDWSPDRISIRSDSHTDGLAIILPGGGRGVITGGLDRPVVDGRRKMQPNLNFAIVGEPINELLAAAIPLTEHDREHLPDADDWPGTAFAAPARLLQGIGLEGVVNTTGRIETSRVVARSANGEASESSASDENTLPQITYAFDVHLAHGTARPAIQLADHVGAAGLFWPSHFAVSNVQGHLFVSDERINLLGFHGWHGSGEVFATGRIDRVAEPTTIALDVRLSDLDLHESIINLVPREGGDVAREWWGRYQPHGRFTADLALRETGDVRHPIEFIASPTVCHVTIDGEPVSFSGLGGHISITASDEPIVQFENLRLNVRHGGQDHGDLLISGAYGVTASENPLHVHGEWANAAIESPVVLELMHLIGAERHRQWYAEYSPRGRVDAAFDYESSHAIRGDAENQPWQQDRYWLSMTPHNLAFVLEQTPIEVHFDPSSSVLLTPGHVQFIGFAGRVADSTFQVNGDVIFDSSITAVLDVDFRGRVAGDEVMAIFPARAQSVLRQLEFDDGRYTEVQKSRLQLTGEPTATGEGAAMPEYDWTVTYDGRLHLNGASMQIGVPATEIDGAFDMNLYVAPDAPPKMRMSAAFDSFRVIDRLITELQADEIRLSDDGRTVRIPEIRGQSYGGMVLADATVGMGEHDRYELTVELAGLELSELYADRAERLAAANGGDATGRPRTPRGEVFGGVKIAGRHGRPESRNGRGTIRAVGGNIENIPILLQAFSVLQLNVPLRGSLDQANAEFYIDGDHVIFERILFESTVAEQFAAFQLIGHGWMDINTLEINTQFRSRSGMLVWRDIAGGLGDQLYLIEIRGTPADPRARLLPLPWLLQPFGPPPDLGRAPASP